MDSLDERLFHATARYLHTLTRGGAWPQGQIHALVYLDRHREQPVTPTQLSQILRVRPSTITPMLQRLEDQGLLCRIQSREDRRQVFLTITPEGRDFLEENRRRLLTFYRSLLARLGPEEAALFLDLLEKISDPLPPISLGPVPKKGCEPPC